MRTGQLRPQSKVLDHWQLLHESDFEDTDTKLLLHLDNEVTDWAKGATVTNTNVTFSATTWKFNTHSAVFNGTTAYLTIPDSADWYFGTGNFTVDCWVRFSSVSANQVIFSQTNVALSEQIVFTFYHVANILRFQAITVAGGNVIDFYCSFDPIVDTWYHIALVRVNTDNAATGWRIFVDGVSQTLTLDYGAWSGTMPDIVGYLMIGAVNNAAVYCFNGYLDELRIVKGTAKWTSDFTPPTAPYLGRTTTYPITKDRNTVLMISGEGADASTSIIDECGKAVTVNGGAQIDTAQFKFGQSSILFDGNGDYLSLADSADWYFGDQNFTIDFWVRWNDLTGQQILMGQVVDGTHRWICSKDSDQTLYMQFCDGGGGNKGYYTTPVQSLSTGVWYHLTFVRDGIVGKIFVNGVSQTLTENVAFGTNNVGDLASLLYVGSYDGTTLYFNGWLDDIRITKGIARWTYDFTPPLKTTALINGDTDEEYRFLSSVVLGYAGTTTFGLFPNQSSGTDCGYQGVWGADTATAAGRATNDSFLLPTAHTTVGVISDSDMLIYAKSGYVRTAISPQITSVSGTTVTGAFLVGQSWNNTTAPIAAFTVKASNTGGIGCGSKLLLYRKVQ